ncbi:uncharacterized [Tachysurus ichikawai]
MDVEIVETSQKLNLTSLQPLKEPSPVLGQPTGGELLPTLPTLPGCIPAVWKMPAHFLGEAALCPFAMCDGAPLSDPVEMCPLPC